ncbi:MAG TPA: ribonuclease HII [Coriobacteriia bacterium]|nr:ribonuclease HII [Coriobacteriia bacterium]
MDRPSVSHIRLLLTEADSASLPGIASTCADDDRPGVVAALASARRRIARLQAEARRLDDLCAREAALYGQGCTAVAGVDEVGRGALAGPVTAAAVVFGPNVRIPGLRDSKDLAPAARERLDREIRAVGIVGIAHIEPAVIDKVGIGRATLIAMAEAVASLPCAVDHVLVDGLVPLSGHPSTAIVKGDATVRAIAAASIVAKVARDALMAELGTIHPGFGFAGNKGYGSPDHLAALAERGPSRVHRLSFAPCTSQRLF